MGVAFDIPKAACAVRLVLFMIFVAVVLAGVILGLSVLR